MIRYTHFIPFIALAASARFSLTLVMFAFLPPDITALRAFCAPLTCAFAFFKRLLPVASTSGVELFVQVEEFRLVLLA